MFLASGRALERVGYAKDGSDGDSSVAMKEFLSEVLVENVEVIMMCFENVLLNGNILCVIE